jgi:hypothetical protein
MYVFVPPLLRLCYRYYNVGVLDASLVRGQTRVLWGNPRSDPSSMGESFFFPLYQARKYVLTSWYCSRVLNPSSGMGVWGDTFVSLSEGCNPSSGKGVWGATKSSYVRTYVCMFFVIPQMSRDHARQKHLAKAATAAPRRGTYVIVTYATVPRRRERQAG